MAKRRIRRSRLTATLPRSSASEVETFLTSSGKNVELLPEVLRSALTIKTGLEDVLTAAIDANKSVAIAGTAGSGKSHLLRSITIPSTYRVISDLTATKRGQWKDLFKPKAKTIVVGNEGAFLLGQRKGHEGFGYILDTLHSIQTGMSYTGPGPTVIDAAGFSPTQSAAIEKMLVLPPIRAYIREFAGDMAKAAWEMLGCPGISRRLSTIVEMASSVRAADGFTFRLLWHFAADLALAAKENVPWYCRVFNSPTQIGEHIRAAFNPNAVAMPHVANRLWYGDINFVRPRIHEEAYPALAREVAALQQTDRLDERRSFYDRISLLAMFALRESPLEEGLKGGVDLWSSVLKKECRPLLQAINKYFTYGLIDVGDDLELWMQYETERRDFKPSVQASAGTARACDFTIVKSLVVGNAPSGSRVLHGGRYLLRHESSGAVLVITKELVDGISSSRSHKVVDRKDVEYDCRLANFFERVAPAAARPDRLNVAAFDFQGRTGKLLRWQLGTPIRKLSG